MTWRGEWRAYLTGMKIMAAWRDGDVWIGGGGVIERSAGGHACPPPAGEHGWMVWTMAAHYADFARPPLQLPCHGRWTWGRNVSGWKSVVNSPSTTPARTFWADVVVSAAFPSGWVVPAGAWPHPTALTITHTHRAPTPFMADPTPRG